MYEYLNIRLPLITQHLINSMDDQNLVNRSLMDFCFAGSNWLWMLAAPIWEMPVSLPHTASESAQMPSLLILHSSMCPKILVSCCTCPMPASIHGIINFYICPSPVHTALVLWSKLILSFSCADYLWIPRALIIHEFLGGADHPWVPRGRWSHMSS